MPIDMSAVLIRKEQAKTNAQADTTVLLMSVVVCLINLALIFISPPFADAVALTGLN
jgi:hypothetical protein